MKYLFNVMFLHYNFMKYVIVMTDDKINVHIISAVIQVVQNMF